MTPPKSGELRHPHNDKPTLLPSETHSYSTSFALPLINEKLERHAQLMGNAQDLIERANQKKIEPWIKRGSFTHELVREMALPGAGTGHSEPNNGKFTILTVKTVVSSDRRLTDGEIKQVRLAHVALRTAIERLIGR